MFSNARVEQTILPSQLTVQTSENILRIYMVVNNRIGSNRALTSYELVDSR